MEFSQRLVALRKAKKFTQQMLADKIEMKVLQIRRYELGKSQPTLEAIRRIAIALECSTDMLIFGKEGKKPNEENCPYLEAINELDFEGKKIITAIAEGLILRAKLKK